MAHTRASIYNGLLHIISLSLYLLRKIIFPTNLITKVSLDSLLHILKNTFHRPATTKFALNNFHFDSQATKIFFPKLLTYRSILYYVVKPSIASNISQFTFTIGIERHMYIYEQTNELDIKFDSTLMRCGAPPFLLRF